MTAILIVRRCAVHGPQTTWHEHRDTDGGRVRITHTCMSYETADGAVCELEVGRPREFVPVGLVEDTLRQVAPDYTSKPRRLTEMVVKRLSWTRREARR